MQNDRSRKRYASTREDKVSTVTDAAKPTLPAFFEPMLVEQYGPELAALVVAGCDARRSSSLRANALFATREEVAESLTKAGISWSSVSWYEDAFIIEDAGEKALWDLSVYDEGKIYLQSLSSMLPPLVLGAKPGIDILDMCAAPGGKTTQLAAIGGKGTHITACEMNVPRAEKLEYNLRKQGAKNVVVMRTDARQLDDFFSFDRILLDAPCSGSGTLRTRDRKLHAHFTEKLVQKSCKSQRALLDKALALLKPGGTLVYSTCSVLKCENEDIVKAALKQASRRGTYEIEPVELEGAALIPADQVCASAEKNAGNIPVLPTSIEGTLCVCPTDQFEGFFVAKIKRTK